MNELITYLDKVSPLSEDSKAVLQTLLVEQTFAKKEIIQNTDSSCKTLYFITEGIARIFYYKDGDDITEHFAFNSNLIIRAESLFTGLPTSKGIQALTPLQLIKIEASALFALFETHIDIERLFYKLITQEYLMLTKRVEQLQINTATERYEDLLTQTPLVNTIPLKYIATYLGITHVSLSRIRAEYAQRTH